jgi:hypothetical protein
VWGIYSELSAIEEEKKRKKEGVLLLLSWKIICISGKTSYYLLLPSNSAGMTLFFLLFG